MFQYQTVNKNNNNDGKMYQEAFRQVMVPTTFVNQSAIADWLTTVVGNPGRRSRKKMKLWIKLACGFST